MATFVAEANWNCVSFIYYTMVQIHVSMVTFSFKISRPLWSFLKGTETKYEMKTKRVLINKEQKQI